MNKFQARLSSICLHHVDVLLRAGADSYALDGAKWLPLSSVTFQGQVETIRFFIKNDFNINGTDRVCRCSRDKMLPINQNICKHSISPVFWAIQGNQLDCLKLLLSAGADINIINTNFRFQTPLHFAASTGKIDYVKSLLEFRADLDAKDRDHITPLMLAVNSNHSFVVRELLIAKCDPTIKTSMLNKATMRGFRLVLN